MAPADQTPPESKEPIPPADTASLQGKEPAPPNRSVIPAREENSSETSLGMFCMILFLALFAAFLFLLSILMEYKGAYEYAMPELKVCSWISFSAVAGLVLLYPFRRREIATLPLPKPLRTGCLLGCSAPVLVFAGLLGFVALAFGRLFIALPILVGIPLFVLFLLWFNKAPNASPHWKTRTLRLFIPHLPFLILIGLFLGGIAAPNLLEYRMRACSVRSHTASEVRQIWGEPLWSSEETMIYATKKDQLVVVFFAKSPIYILKENDNPREPRPENQQAPFETPRVVRIAILETSGKFVEGSRTIYGRSTEPQVVGYYASAPSLRLIDSPKASAKARERLVWLLDSGALKEQIARTPSLLSKIPPGVIQPWE